MKPILIHRVLQYRGGKLHVRMFFSKARRGCCATVAASTGPEAGQLRQLPPRHHHKWDAKVMNWLGTGLGASAHNLAPLEATDNITPMLTSASQQ